MLQRIGRYEILDRVASGGQGTVYRARDTVLDRVVAVKVINQSIADDPAYLEALQREARLAARLDHPNITRVHDFQVEDGIPYIVMEYVPDALDRHLQNGRRLPWEGATEIAVQIARALQHAHDNGVVHRDIKPQNILLREDGSVAVSDYGIARALASSTRSRTSSVMGTPAYMSPEQWASGSLDGRIDQYALGIVFYEMLAGSTPFQGESMEAMYVQHRETPLPAFASNLQIPAGVQQVIRRSTEKGQDARYASAGEMADELETSLARSPTGERSSASPPIPPRQPVASGAGSRLTGGMPSRLLFGGLGAIIIALIAIAVAMASGGNGGRQETVTVPVTREVPVTVVVQKVVAQKVEVTREVPVTVATFVEREVTKEVPVTRVVEKEVVKEVPVPVTRVVEKEVIKEVPVTRVVRIEVPVTRTVPVTIIVTATPPPLCLDTSDTNAVYDDPGPNKILFGNEDTYTIHYRVTNNCGQYKNSYRTTLVLLDSAGKIVGSANYVGSGLEAGSSRLLSGKVKALKTSNVTTYRIEIN